MALTGGAAILAKLRKQRTAVANEKPENPVVVIAYASQTGTAQDIAQSISANCNERQIKSKVLSLNDLKFENLSSTKTPVIISVVSTTGDGDPPDNSQTFFKDMKNARNQSAKECRLNGIKYTCLGLGDSNYTSFMAIPTRFKKGFDDLGAARFYECREVDEVDGLEELVDEWIDGLWDSLKSTLASLRSGSADQTDDKKNNATAKKTDIGVSVDLSGMSDSLKDFVLPPGFELHGVAAKPVSSVRATLSDECVRSEYQSQSVTGNSRFLAPITAAEKMTADGSDREVYLLTVDLTTSGMTYIPGDSLEIMPENDGSLVDDLLRRLHLDGTQTLELESLDGSDSGLSHIPRGRPLRECFIHTLGVRSVLKKTVLRFLAEHCSDEEEGRRLKYLVSRPGSDAYLKFIVAAKASLMDVLISFPSCQPPLDGLLEFLPPLMPRPYSIACSERVSLPRFFKAFGKCVNAPGVWKQRVATGWLKQQIHSLSDCKESERPKLRVSIRSGGAFRLPEEIDRPLILIGPGTGVAPFLGFLQERKQRIQNWNGHIGSCWLFYGCRREDEDYLFRSELESLHDDAVISHLHVAFSRQFDRRVYVQHLMLDNSEALYQDIFQSNGSSAHCVSIHKRVLLRFVFVCGDGMSMAQDVQKCLTDILVRHGQVTEAEAKEKLNQKLKEHSYVKDVWS